MTKPNKSGNNLAKYPPRINLSLNSNVSLLSVIASNPKILLPIKYW